MSKQLNWTFTVNNYGESSIADILALVPDKASFVIVGEEVAPVTETPHLQGFIVWNERKRIAYLHEHIQGAAAFASKGTAAQNIAYCSKDGVFHSAGTAPMSRSQQRQSQIERYDLARNAAREGRFEDIPSDLFIRYQSSFKMIHRDAYRPPPIIDGPLQNEWIFGPAGSGKSQYARSEYPEAYLKNPKSKWWDGYNNQSVVIIDDVDKYMKSLAYEIKIWSDRYPFPAETKGSSLVIRPHRVIITSQYQPNEIWDDQETLDAINRRFIFYRANNTELIRV